MPKKADILELSEKTINNLKTQSGASEMIIKMMGYFHGLISLFFAISFILCAIGVFVFNGFFIGIVSTLALFLLYGWFIGLIDDSYQVFEDHLKSRF